MTLHEAIEQVLIQYGTPMAPKEIADALNKNSWYTKKDGSLIKSSQIGARVENYPHLFTKNGSFISLKSKIGISKVVRPVKAKTSVAAISGNSSLSIKVLMNEKNFKLAKDIDNSVPNSPGLYCIRVLDIKKLPLSFNQVLASRKHNIIYIGIASQNLSKRFLGQELRARGHGTFFRSLGAVLGYRPESGSLKDKVNKNNYTFSKSDEAKIIEWINQNLLVNWVTVNEGINQLEDQLIKQHLPLLNITGNPGAVLELRVLREECKQIGRGNK